ncbi:sensor histidine kinase [Novosphingobium endophyticum]|uniref:sensor histidine kinase n=1 Tax=Novosphingobium endophyticum TaxID=1955250 RepID=UPI00166B0A42|nr:HAMP domain-containing sensor histidine kinase [Novosphingobium endophyticum]
MAIIFLVLGSVQLAASLIFYQSIDRQTLREDHARRVAELLVVSDRVHALTPARTSPIMSTRHLTAEVASRPSVRTLPTDDTLKGIASKIVEWEPSLSNRSLRLAAATTPAGEKDLIGSIRLTDGNWLNFRSEDFTSMWPVALRATALTFATAVACLTVGLVVLHLMAQPLRRIADAAEAIGQGRYVSINERGSRDLRELAHAMNVMQERIARLLQDQAKTFEAISHDLRTPLSRQKVAAELIDDEELAGMILASVDEMEALLASLQKFLRAQHLSASPEKVELVPFLRDVVAEFGEKVEFAAGSEPAVRTFREPLALAVLALVENAIQFGDKARLSLQRNDGGWEIAVEDDGPGIPPDYFDAILDPFFRMDEARQRDTKGFGLGIPTAHRLMMRFNGGLSFARSAAGGLIARLSVPAA